MTAATFHNEDSFEQTIRAPLLGDIRRAAEDEASMPNSQTLLVKNLFGDGRALFTQVGCILLVASVLSFTIPNPAGLFSYHPPLQAVALVLFAQGVLTLQPTRTKSDKEKGLVLHQIFQISALLLISAGTVIMLVNKALHNAAHFTSWHGVFGLASVILMLVQSLQGALISSGVGYKIFGDVAKAKKLWKYHRASGYIILPLSLVTASLATTSATWILQNSSLVQRVCMTAGLAMIALGLWSGASLQKLGIKTA